MYKLLLCVIGLVVICNLWSVLSADTLVLSFAILMCGFIAGKD